MKLNAIFIGLLSAHAALAVVVKRARQLPCDNGEIIHQQVSDFNGKEFKVTICTKSTTPAISSSLIKAAASKARVSKRQENVCNADCTVVCDTPSGNAPFASDCDELVDALEDMQPNDFVVPAGGSIEFTLTDNTCGGFYENLSGEEQETCGLGVGLDIGLISAQCFPDFDVPQASSDGACIPPGQTWGVLAFLL